MKVTRAQAQANRQRVLVVAGEKFRERGYDGIGVAELMQAAGLTHGGFYGQFPSKRALAAEATATAFADLSPIWTEAVAQGGADGLAHLVRGYLSAEHRDARAVGCPLAALGSDAPRQDGAIAEVFAAGIRDRLASIEALLPAGPEARAQALAKLATLVGALVLSRAVGTDPLSEDILAAARTAASGSPPSAAEAGNEGCDPLNSPDGFPSISMS